MSHRSGSRAPGSRAPSPLHPASQSGDYYRDTNLVSQKTGASNMSERLRKQGSNSNMSQYAAQQQMYGGGMPQLPFMPFAGGPGSVAGSDYGGQQMQMPPMGFQNTGGSMYGSMYGTAPMMPQYTGSMYGVPQIPAVGQFGEMGGSQSGLGAPSAPAMSMNQRPMSTFSMATTVNPFAGGPSMNPNPSDDELFTALRNYLSTQDLMTVTKKYVAHEVPFPGTILIEVIGLLVRRSCLASPRRICHPVRTS
jgi:chitin synthase